MSEKIAMPALTAMLSVRTGDSREQTESFLREFFELITAGLEAGDSIKIPGVGIFKTINVEARKSVNVNTGEETIIPEHRKVVFLPGRELAATVNAPFEMFQTMELTDELAAVFEEPQPESEPAPEPEPQTEPEPEPEPEHQPENPENPEVLEILEKQEEPEEQEQQEEQEEPQEQEEPDYYDDAEPEQTVIVKRRFWPGFFVGFGAACLCMLIAMGIVAYVTITEPDDDNMTVTAVTPAPVQTHTVVPDSAVKTAPTASGEATAKPNAQAETPAVPTQPSDQPVYDTISKTRYLTTMAKDHYGNFHLWPYIYMENEKILGHPDRIKPGTRVVVPDLAKYGVNSKNPADIEKAKKLGLDIYARYNK